MIILFRFLYWLTDYKSFLNRRWWSFIACMCRLILSLRGKNASEPIGIFLWNTLGKQPIRIRLRKSLLLRLFRENFNPQKSQVPIGTFFGHNQSYKFLSFYLITVGEVGIFLLWNEAVQKTITTLKTIYRGTFVQKMGTVAPVV